MITQTIVCEESDLDFLKWYAKQSGIDRQVLFRTVISGFIQDLKETAYNAAKTAIDAAIEDDGGILNSIQKNDGINVIEVATNQVGNTYYYTIHFSYNGFEFLAKLKQEERTTWNGSVYCCGEEIFKFEKTNQDFIIKEK